MNHFQEMIPRVLTGCSRSSRSRSSSSFFLSGTDCRVKTGKRRSWFRRCRCSRSSRSSSSFCLSGTDCRVKTGKRRAWFRRCRCSSRSRSSRSRSSSSFFLSGTDCRVKTGKRRAWFRRCRCSSRCRCGLRCRCRCRLRCGRCFDFSLEILTAFYEDWVDLLTYLKCINKECFRIGYGFRQIEPRCPHHPCPP